MSRDPDFNRIATKAHELWESEGHPHGRDQAHWDQARELVAIEDSYRATLKPRDAGVDAPIEDPEAAIHNLADMPNLTDQGENLLTSTDREPDLVATPSARQGRMPDVEVPTSDQPGIPAKAKRGRGTGQSSSNTADAASAERSSAPQPKSASVPQRAKPDASKPESPSAARKGGRRKAE